MGKGSYVSAEYSLPWFGFCIAELMCRFNVFAKCDKVLGGTK